MNFKTRLHDELNRLQALAGPNHLPQQLTLTLAEGELECVFVSIDQLACAVERITYRAGRLSAATLEQLSGMATKLSQRLSYLLEAIRPVETDRDECIVQMRSNPPQKDDDGTSYYEVVVRRGEIGLVRYAKGSGQSRRIIPAHLTREVLARLVLDLAGATP
ncbi:MAG: hypothetical protein AB7F89_14235 [Pirellulaceae bacterium]